MDMYNDIFLWFYLIKQATNVLRSVPAKTEGLEKSFANKLHTNEYPEILKKVENTGTVDF